MGIAQNPNGVGGLGYGQSYASAARTSGVTYYNTSGKPRHIIIVPAANINSSLSIIVDGLQVSTNAATSSGVAKTQSAIIPIGKGYSCTLSGTTLVQWYELG